jgi:hypothetical protein
MRKQIRELEQTRLESLAQAPAKGSNVMVLLTVRGGGVPLSPMAAMPRRSAFYMTMIIAPFSWLLRRLRTVLSNHAFVAIRSARGCAPRRLLRLGLVGLRRPPGIVRRRCVVMAAKTERRMRCGATSASAGRGCCSDETELASAAASFRAEGAIRPKPRSRPPLSWPS